MKRKSVSLLAVALLAGACARGGPGASDELRVIPLEGDVFVLDGQERTSIDEAEELGLGTVVATGASGRALVDLTLGQAVELAPESSLRVTGDDETELLTGQVLAGAPAGLTVSSGAAEVSGSGGFFRLDRYVGAMRLGVYSGSATVRGWDGRLAALEQVGVAAGIVPEAPVPLQVDPSDPWDVRRLRQAIQVGLSLNDLQRGLGAELQGGGAGPDTISRVLPQGLPTEDATRYLHRVSPSEALVASMVAIQAARRDALSSLDALREVVRLRELGASWIVVVARWRLYTDAILNGLARITDLIARTLIPVVATGGTDATIGGAATTTSSGGGSGTGGTGSPTGTDTGGTTGSGGGGNDGGDDGGGSGGGGGGGAGDPDPCASEVECAVQDVIGEAGGVGDGLGIG